MQNILSLTKLTNINNKTDGHKTVFFVFKLKFTPLFLIFGLENKFVGGIIFVMIETLAFFVCQLWRELYEI